MKRGVWTDLPQPIIGLSPMDGVTDPAFRAVVDDIGHPSILYTEFVSSEGLSRGIPRLLATFSHHTSKTPLIGQLFGATEYSMYVSAIICCALGLSGIDINMGCPHKHVTKNGGGAKLITTPALAVQIIKTVKKAILDWANGITLEKLGLPDKFIFDIKKRNPTMRRIIVPISVKTRTGYDKPITKEWVSILSDAHPSAIELHGRTLSQGYTGKADWEQIALAADIAHNNNISCLGNGDISSFAMANNFTKKYHTDGVLIGRASYGNPWIFSGKKPIRKSAIDAARLHCSYFQSLTPKNNVLSLRKHMAWYTKGFTDAVSIRKKIMVCETLHAFDTLFQSL